MFSLLRLERQQKNSSNPFRIRIVVLSLSVLLIWNLNDKYVHTQPVVPSKTTRFQTKMGKVYTSFHTKTKTLPDGAKHTYIAFIREYPRPSWGPDISSQITL